MCLIHSKLEFSRWLSMAIIPLFRCQPCVALHNYFIRCYYFGFFTGLHCQILVDHGRTLSKIQKAGFVLDESHIFNRHKMNKSMCVRYMWELIWAHKRSMWLCNDVMHSWSCPRFPPMLIRLYPRDFNAWFTKTPNVIKILIIYKCSKSIYIRQCKIGTKIVFWKNDVSKNCWKMKVTILKLWSAKVGFIPVNFYIQRKRSRFQGDSLGEIEVISWVLFCISLFFFTSNLITYCLLKKLMWR